MISPDQPVAFYQGASDFDFATNPYLMNDIAKVRVDWGTQKVQFFRNEDIILEVDTQSNWAT